MPPGKLRPANPPVAPEIDEELRRYLNPIDYSKPYNRDAFKSIYANEDDTGGNPGIVAPSMFVKNPNIRSIDPVFNEVAKSLLDLSPQAKVSVGRGPGIIAGPDKSVFEQLLESNLGLGSFANTNLLGDYDRRSGEIAVNPRLGGSDMAKTLGHELAHSVGYPHGRDLYNIQGLARMKYEAEDMERRKRLGYK